MSFDTLIQMAKLGDFSKRLLTNEMNSCHACMFGKATKIPWSVKGKSISRTKPVTAAGECVSFNQLESPTPGLITQMKGIPTIKRYKYVTVIVEHYSRFTFV